MTDSSEIPPAMAAIPRLKVLLSAYACEPGKGSEPGTGWHLAMELSRHFDVTVLTRSNNREPIEKALEGLAGSKPAFLYHDLSGPFRLLKKHGLLPTQAYYALWQRMSRLGFPASADPASFDIFHHLTFNSFEIPPGIPTGFQGQLIRGPLGGGQTAPVELLVTLPPLARFKERLRSLRVRRSAASRALRRHLAACGLVLYANQETRALLADPDTAEDSLMIDVGVDPAAFTPVAISRTGTRLFAASNFEPRKGTRLLLLAFREAYQKNPELRLRIAGSGRDQAREQDWVRAHGLTEAVHFLGRRDHRQMAEELAAADFFVFPSLRDTSGAIVLEAMSCGLPVVCLDHQGAAIMVDESCGIRVPPSPLAATVDGIARAMLRLAGDSDLRHTMGLSARAKVMAEFSWQKKAGRLACEYARLSGHPG
jgi:glycosyltransferase involved in cell wall biosynthesis